LENALIEKQEVGNFLFSSGRSAFAYLLKLHDIERVWLPYYNCDVILEPLKVLNIDFDFYNIDKNLLPDLSKIDMKDNSAIVVNNYFGLLDNELNLMDLGDRVIFDNSQAFYSKLNGGLGAFNSLRKFFGMADGASVTVNTGHQISGNWPTFNAENGLKYLEGRKKDGAQEHYHEYLEFERTLEFKEIMEISTLSRNIYSKLDHPSIAEKRISNFGILQKALDNKNQLKLNISDSVPMIYPLLIEDGSKLKRHLIERQIYVPTYWPNKTILSDESSFETYLMKNLVVLPIDQRYGKDEMHAILAEIERYAG